MKLYKFYYNLYKNELEFHKSTNIQYNIELKIIESEYLYNIKEYNNSLNLLLDVIEYCKEGVYYIYY